MSAWFTIYCTRSVANVTAADLMAEIKAADLHTDAEVWGIEDESIVNEALSHLTISRVAEMDSVRFELRYAGADQLPVLICIWVGSSAEKLLSDIRDTEEDGSPRLRPILQRTVAVVDLFMNATHQDHMGVVLASRLAEIFASAGHGIIRDHNDDWWAVENGVPLLVLSRGDDA